MSTALILVGLVGLVFCGAVRVFPKLVGAWHRGDAQPGLSKIVGAYDVLSRALTANGNTQSAEDLRCKILPAAVQTAGTDE